MLPVSILGTRVLRAAEDPRFLTGGDRYIDNIDVDGAAHVVFVYSTVAHARIAAIDTADARSMPGVLGVYTAADVGLPPKRVDMARVAEAVRASLALAELPLTVRTEPVDAALPLVQAGEHAMALLEARAEGGDPHLLLYPLSASEGAVRGAQATNFSFYRNARLDDVLIRASQLSFRPERQRLYLRAQTMLSEELPWIPLYVRLHWAVLRPEVRNLRLHPSGNHRLDRVTLEASSPAPAAPTR